MGLAVTPPTGVPHSPQKSLPGGGGPPEVRQPAAGGAPHDRQNLSSGAPSAPHAGQRRMSVESTPGYRTGPRRRSSPPVVTIRISLSASRPNEVTCPTLPRSVHSMTSPATPSSTRNERIQPLHQSEKK